jgi:amino acid transporter
LAPWAFVGFDAVSFDTAHFRFPLKKTGRILAASIVVAGLIYMAMAVVGVSFVPDGYASWGAYLSDLDSLKGVASVPTFYAAEEVNGRAVSAREIRMSEEKLSKDE